MSDKILLFIPMYNCVNQIPRVIAQLDKETAGWFAEVMVIDNRSSDDSANAAIKALEASPVAAWRVVQNVENYNLGGSHKVAFNHALENAFDYAVILHGDDQGDIHDLISHLEKAEHRDVECLLGARFMRGSQLEKYSWARTWGNRVFNVIFSIACGCRLHDLGSGLNMYSRDFLKSRFYLRFPNMLTFNYYMILYTVAAKAPYRFFPLSWREADQASNVRLVTQAVNMLEVLRMYLFSRRKYMNDWHTPEQTYECEILKQVSES